MIDFYFDFVSPFGYFASLRIEALARRHGLSVRWHPILIGVTVMKIMQLPPILEIPLKGEYIKRELARYQRVFGLKLLRDPALPPDSGVAASRAMAALNRLDPARAVAFAHAAYHAYWQGGSDLNASSSVCAIAAAAGVDERAWPALSASTARDALREEMDEAVHRGVFGSPFFLIDEEPFFGVDKLESIDHWLAAGRP